MGKTPRVPAHTYTLQNEIHGELDKYFLPRSKQSVHILTGLSSRLLFTYLFIYKYIYCTHIYKTTVVTKILPILVTPENSMSHSESVNFTTFLISVGYAVNYEKVNVSAKSSHMEDQRCKECKL
jgi:hypothetical protein